MGSQVRGRLLWRFLTWPSRGEEANPACSACLPGDPVQRGRCFRGDVPTWSSVRPFNKPEPPNRGRFAGFYQEALRTRQPLRAQPGPR